MKSKEEKEPYTTLGGNSTELTVQKSRPFQTLLQSKLSLIAHKILDIYLARINSHNPQNNSIIFKKDELEKILGVKEIKFQSLHSVLEELKQPYKVFDKKKNGYSIITIFEHASLNKDTNGLWDISLQCSESALPYIFQIEKKGYVKYKLKNILTLKSKYSYILYVYLESQRTMHLTWNIKIDDIKKLLQCDTQETYNEYKHFNNKVLKRAQQELNKKTDCNFHYEPIKAGRSVIKIKITLSSKSEIKNNSKLIDEFNHNFDDIEKILEIAGITDGEQIDFSNNHFDIKQNDCCNCDEIHWYDPFYPQPKEDETLYSVISKGVDLVPYEGYSELESLIKDVPESKLPKNIFSDVSLSRIDYVKSKIREMELYDNQKQIKNKYSYLWKMIYKDIKN